MKKYSLLPILCYFIFSTGSTLNAQDWMQMMKDPKANVHDVQKAFYKWQASHPKETPEKATKGETEEDCNYTLYKRWEWLMEPRSYPSGNIPDMAKMPGMYNKLFNQDKLQTGRRPEKIQSNANWVYKGNTTVPTSGGDGRVNRVRFYPGNNNIMYACAPTGGLWKSTNGGTSWSTNTDQLAELGTSDLAINPLKPNVMYLATGDCDGPGGDFHSISTIGVLKSMDGGNTWNPSGLSYTQASTGPAYGTVTELALNPVDTNIIIAATSGGMYYSSNSGASWTQEDTEYFRSVEFEPFHPSTVYGSTGDGKFFRSTDGGQTYTQTTTGLPAFGLTARMTLAVTPADSNYVYVVAEDASSRSYYGLYKSTDRGQTFTQQSNSSVGSLSVDYGWYGLPLAVSPTNVDSIITGGLDVYLSANGGVSWRMNSSWTGSGAPYAHADGHHYIFLPGSGAIWFDACDGGIFKATNHGATYTDLSNNLQIGEIYAIGASALTSGLWLSGWQDNGTNESGNPWTEVNGGDGMVPFIDNTNDNNMYSASQDGSLYFSNDGGVNWNYITSNITENGPWLTRWMQDPLSPNTLFAGFSNIWMSTNQGGNWTQISSFSSTSSRILSLIVDPLNDKVLYTCWDDSIFMTTNQTSWKNITDNLPVSEAWMTSIALDPNNYNHAWVTFSGYADTVKVFQTYNGGSTWTNISAGLPNLPVNCIIFQPNSNSGIYVGTDDGIYYRDTVLGNWISYNTGLPDVIVNDLKIVDAGTNLLAASYGRGAWETPVYSTSTGINPVSTESDGLRVYPNPSNGNINLNIDIPTAGDYTLSVYNVMGQKVYSNTIALSGHYSTSLNLSEYGSGCYMITLNGQGQLLEKKVILY
jgi:photosystem II stability/assembly factor-like uncharacterized protein